MPESDEDPKIHCTHGNDSPVGPKAADCDNISEAENLEECVMPESYEDAPQLTSPIESDTSVMPVPGSLIESDISVMPESRDGSIQSGNTSPMRYCSDSEDHSSAIMCDADPNELAMNINCGLYPTNNPCAEGSVQVSEDNDSDMVMPESDDDISPRKFVEIENLSGSTSLVYSSIMLTMNFDRHHY